MLFLVFLLGLSSLAHGLENQACERASAGVKVLQRKWYDESSGTWGCGNVNSAAGWWQCANTLEIISNYAVVCNDETMVSVILHTYNTTLRLFPEKCATAKFNDDIGWWGLAWLRARDALLHFGSKDLQDELVERAACYWNREASFWDETCNGGVWWTTDKNYKNAITNELFLSLGMRLHEVTGNATYLQWVEREWAWFAATGMINSEHLINDGLTSACVSNNETAYTYNQGVLLTGLSLLSQEKNDSSLLDLAVTIANQTISTLVTPNGILQEFCEKKSIESNKNACGADGSQFKGIFIRHLGYLIDHIGPSHPSQAPFKAFIQRNAESIWDHDQKMDGVFGLSWSGPPGIIFLQRDEITHSSALDCLIAAAL